MNDSAFRPNYSLTESMTSSIEHIDRNRWLIENMLLMPKHEAWIRREVAVRRAAATTRIEGANLDEEEVSNLIRKGTVGKLKEDEIANFNALRAYEFVDYISAQLDIPLDELVIRQLNREFLMGMDEMLTPGVYRKGENTVGSFTPPNQGDVPALMRSFAQWLGQDDEEMHPIVRAGIAHIHLVAVHPFWDGNGRAARALATLVLQRSPFGFKMLLSLEQFHHAIRDDYFTAIERTLGQRFKEGYDATPWLEFFVKSLMAHTMQLTAKFTDWHRIMNDLYGSVKELVNFRQAEGLLYANYVGRITRSDYIDIAKVSAATASRDLAELVTDGWLIAEGKTRTRSYVPKPPSESKAEQVPEEQLRLVAEE